MKKIFTLCFMAIAMMASANTYTLSDLATLVPVMEDGTGVAVVDGAYVINLPASLPEGVSGLGFDNDNIVLTKTYFTINGDLVISEGETLLFGGSTTMEVNGNLTITGATIGAAEGSEGTAKGFRMYQEGASATITGSEFNYVGINYGNGTEEGCLTVTGCTFNNHNTKGGNAVINFTSLSKVPMTSLSKAIKCTELPPRHARVVSHWLACSEILPQAHCMLPTTLSRTALMASP